MARKKSTKAEAAEEAVAVEETEMEHTHEELEAKLAALEARVAELEKEDLVEKATNVVFDKLGDIVEEKIKKALKNVKAGKVDLDFEEIFQWMSRRRRRGRPFGG
jgi:hypothetical protein